MYSLGHEKTNKSNGLLQTVEPDRRGYYTIMMPNKNCPSTDPVELECLFGQAGVVRDINFGDNCTFLRFLTAAEAMKAIKLFAAEYKVKPAMSKKRNCTQNERDNTKDMEMSPTDSPVNGITKSKKLFVANIECEESFQELIKPYNPVSVTVIQKEIKTFAFLTMNSEEDATKMIEELNNKVQTSRKLFVTYNTRVHKQETTGDDDVHSIASENSCTRTNSKSITSKTKNGLPSTPPCLSRLEDMPELIHESKVADLENNRMEWCIYISGFKSRSLESTLRNAFSKYNILDICIENNNHNHGLTKATLYLATLYNVLDAIKEMDGSHLDGFPLKVDVPFCYSRERKVVLDILKKSKEASEETF
ncbi:uncharacterized protein LOC106062555 [Biomphalaria glabrata]|uniref:Uncharacterized protein LOC106062555 n=1 Tax=Biomphalaria glabrata TaxID=6526 RepID=A0A9W2YR13_BIOGL|nr:uncharacterized protein LOC106062555 [Biomphalaria glabrata]